MATQDLDRPKYRWPTRDEWAYREQHPYWDSETGCPFDRDYSHRLSDYATAEEIAALTTALKDLYRELGRELRAATARINPSDRQQRGEGKGTWFQCFRQLPPEAKETFCEAERVKDKRSQINNLLVRIRNDAIPDHTRRGSLFGRAELLVTPSVERHAAAMHAARERWEQKCLLIPVDDAAWEKELQRRERIEQIHYNNQRL